MAPSAIYCTICESRIAVPSTRRTETHQQYCSNACRQRAYRRRQAATAPPAARPRQAGAAPLPLRLDKFIGRARELEHLRMLASKRLVTITGPPGAGKSRLVLRHVESPAADCAEAVWLDLEKPGNAERLPHVIGKALHAGAVTDEVCGERMPTTPTHCSPPSAAGGFCLYSTTASKWSSVTPVSWRRC